MSEKKKCFVITPIGEEGSDMRKRRDQVFKYIIAPVVEESGYEPQRADQISDPGAITTQVIQRLVNDPLVIADLTGRNANVFYQLAVRHASHKPLIQMIDRSEDLPFDVATERTVHCDISDLDKAEATRGDLAKQLEAIEQPGFELRTPVSIAVDLATLRTSGNPEQVRLADISQTLAGLQVALGSVVKRVGDPGALLPREYLGHILVPLARRSSPALYEEQILMDLKRAEVTMREALHELDNFFIIETLDNPSSIQYAIATQGGK